MPFLLNLVYLALLLVAWPRLVYAAIRKGKYRAGFAAKLLGNVPTTTDRHGPVVWLHGVSVGEVNLLVPLVAELESRRPGWQIVVSTTTTTGFELARKRFAPRTVFYCPLDFSWAVRRAMRRIHPQLLVLGELELWPNLIRAAHRHGARVAVINGRLSERSFRGYRRLRPLVARWLRGVDLIGAQNATYAERFRELGADRDCVHVTGSIKYDGAAGARENPATVALRRLADIGDDDIVLLAGSTQEPEEEMALEVFRRHSQWHPRMRLLIVPRHPDRFAAVAAMLARSGIRWQLRSRLEREPADPVARVLLVDAMGELAAWWGAAHIAFVGGSMGSRGGQNMIEPAAYGAAVAFGPNTKNFRDVVAAMLDEGAAVVVHDVDELADFVGRCIAEPSYAAELGRRAASLVAANQGATCRTADFLLPLVEGFGAATRVAA